jgi:hypothetical protein
MARIAVDFAKMISQKLKKRGDHYQSAGYRKK